jgi:hypothetical protein
MKKLKCDGSTHPFGQGKPKLEAVGSIHRYCRPRKPQLGLNMLPQHMNSIPYGRVGYTQHHATCVRLIGRQPTCARLYPAVSRIYGA